MAAPSTSPHPTGWRTPAVILVCGCLIAMLSFGPRASMGLFLTPISMANGWGREVFSLAIAVQNLAWGIGQPFAGAVADRFGPMRVLMTGGLLYAAGLALMTVSTTPGTMTVTAGVLIGFALAGSSFNVVLGAFGKLLPPSWRPLALGAGTAAGSFGQFAFAPIGSAMISGSGWQEALYLFAFLMLLVLPFSLALMTRRHGGEGAVAYTPPSQSISQALREAFRERSYVLLVLGFFTCGFQLAFITIHLPPYLVDRGLSVAVGGWTLAVIGLANIVGSLTSGWMSGWYSKRMLLVWNYTLRGVVIAVFILLPASPVTSILFGLAMGLLWLSTVPPTSGLVALMFGNGYMTMLYGFAFFSHQVGGFLGVWLGGWLYEAYGSYDVVWWLAVALGFASALINLPIRERPVDRVAAA